MVAQDLLPEDVAKHLHGLAESFAAGRHDLVVAGARTLLQRYPGLAPGLKLLGSALHQQGRYLDAVAALEEAVRLTPCDAQSFSNLGNALAGAEKFDAALQAHQTAIRLQPEGMTPHYNLACLYLSQQKKNEALASFLTAYQCAPGNYELARLCRQLLLELGDWEQLKAFCRFSLQFLPDDHVAWSMLGSVLLKEPAAGNDEAEAALQRAVGLAPDDVVAWSNLCIALHRQAKLAAAIVAGRQAVALAPEWGAAHNNLGNVLRDSGMWQEAKVAFLQAIRHDNECADAYYNLGCVCADLGEPEMARESYIEALKLSPRPDWMLQGAHACRQVVDWEGAELLEAELTRQLSEEDCLSPASTCYPSPFAYLATPGTTALQQLQVARHFSSQFTNRPVFGSFHEPASDGRLRIGLLSADFRDHATAHLLTGVLEALDAGRFKLIAYDYSPPGDDSYRHRLRRAIPVWVDLGVMSDREVAERMRADGLDIVIDLKGWTQGYRGGILSYRPAPVQMQWLGYPGTLGAPWLDYIIADEMVIPIGAEAGYSEKILRLPGCYQPNDNQRAMALPWSRKDCGLSENGFVMAAFHQPYKITRETFALWLHLLSRIPDGVLWLLEATPSVKEALVGSAVAAGVEPWRLVWAPRLAADQHLGRLAAADLALDVYPVNAHTTASDALWAGVPQIACCGDTFVSRVSASIVCAAGLPELVAQGADEYAALILRLAEQREQLLSMRERLARARHQSLLFDTQAFATNLAKGLEMAWARHEAGADHIDVPL